MGKARFHLLAFVVVAIWGMTFVSTKMLLAAGLLPAQIFLLRFIVAYLGIWLLCISGSPESVRIFSGSVRDDLLAFAAALCWGLYSTFMGQMTRKYGTLFSTRKVFFCGLLTIIPFVIGRPLDFSVFARPQVWMNLLFLSVLASLACFVLWNKVIAGLGNITATNYVYLNPFFTLLAAVLFLGESLTLQSAIGCAAIVLGVIIGGIKK